ncbi:MAG: Lrp/AsnC ligand binding domain-containing protein [Candidatus Bathyarchaeota archaeon]|jgi:DNA-binding Lrp family transcriptional regulator
MKPVSLLLGQVIYPQFGINSQLLKETELDGIMPMAYVLITTEAGAVHSVLDALKKFDSVVETYMVYGVYDIVAVVKSDTMEKLEEIVTWDMRSLDQVRSTLTMIVVEDTK